MKIEKLNELVVERAVSRAQIIRNPDNLSQWFVMIKTDNLALHVLVDDDEKPITRNNIEALLNLMERAGMKSVEVVF